MAHPLKFRISFRQGRLGHHPDQGGRGSKPEGAEPDPGQDRGQGLRHSVQVDHRGPGPNFSAGLWTYRGEFGSGLICGYCGGQVVKERSQVQSQVLLVSC